MRGPKGLTTCLKGHPAPELPLALAEASVTNFGSSSPPFAHLAVLTLWVSFPRVFPSRPSPHTAQLGLHRQRRANQWQGLESIELSQTKPTHTGYRDFSTGSTKKCRDSARTGWRMSLGTQTPCPYVYIHIHKLSDTFFSALGLSPFSLAWSQAIERGL